MSQSIIPQSDVRSLTVADVAVRQDDAGRYCLNDLHRAAGGKKRHGPSYWLANSQTVEIIKELETTGNPVVTIEGAKGGTYVCKELVYAYAMWISARFHLAVIRAYDAMVATPARLPTHLETAKMLVASLEREAALTEALAAAAPKVEFHDEVTHGQGEWTLDEVCAAVFNRAIRRPELLDWMVAQQWMVKDGKRPTAWATDRGYMRTRIDYIGRIGTSVQVAVVTGKGLTLLRHLYRRGDLFTADIPMHALLPKPDGKQ